MVTVKVNLKLGDSNQSVEATLLDAALRHVTSFQQDWKPHCDSSRSEALGYEGRVGLESLPGAEGFYEQRNMIRFEPEIDPYVDDELPLAYFEYPPRRRQDR